jgi:hypothetical protein
MRLPDVVRSAKDVFGLLDRVLRLASHEESGQGNVLVVVLIAREP